MDGAQLSLFEERSESLEEITEERKQIGIRSNQLKIYWGEVAKVTLTRFPELDRGERILTREIRKRISLIRKEDYLGELEKELNRNRFSLKNSSLMNKEQLWRFLIHKIRPLVWNKARVHCPETVYEIERKNEELIRDAYYCR